MLKTKESKNGKAHKGGRKILMSISALAVATFVGIGAFTTGVFGLLPQTSQAEASVFAFLPLTTGTITKTVTGTGTLSMSGSGSVSVPEGLKIESVDAEAGESVQPGDALVTLDKESIQDKLDTLNDNLATLNTELAALSGDTMSSYVTATVKGRVKVIYGQKDQAVEDVMNRYGALMLLSVDGHMKVALDVSGQSVTINQDVVVRTSTGAKIDGYIYALDDGQATVLTSDASLAVGDQVSVQDLDGNVLGSGEAQINNPLRITGTLGTIKSVNYALNAQVSKGSYLFTLKNLPISNAYTLKLAEREKCLDAIDRMHAYLETPVITSDQSGIVNTIALSSGQTLEQESSIVLNTRDSVVLSASVDELDILSVQPGMTAEVTLDALPGETFTGIIQKISAQGSTTSNVTTYPVKIELQDDKRFLPGMSASANIVVDKAENALLVPVSALNSARGETFVYVDSGFTTLSTSTTGDPGVRTPITTGLSNDEYAEVLSGLSATDKVVVTKSAATSSSTNMNMGTMSGMMNMGGGTPPSGGEFQGGNRPSGGSKRS